MESASPNALPAHGEPDLTVRAIRDIAFGSAAGMASKFIEHPFDLTKVRLQAQVLDGPGARFAGPMDCLKQTWAGEGVRGLYRGLPAPLAGAMLENASLFFSYGEIQNVIRWSSGLSAGSPLSLSQLSIAAAGAGAITSTLLTPIELIKCKMQVQMLTPMASGQKPPGPLTLVGIVVRQHGIRGLWLGHTGTVIRETGGGMAWFGTKEAIVSYLTTRRASTLSDSPPAPKAWESAVAGAMAGVAYNIALFPADTVKSAVQTAEELRPNAPRPTYFGMARALWAAQGIRGLYAGCGITIARSAPSSALVFAMYDSLKNYFEA